MYYKKSPIQEAYKAFEKEILEKCDLVVISFAGEVVKGSFGYIDGFHAKDAVVLHLDDDHYFNGIRAETFVIEVGWNEHFEGEAFLVSANHKGNRAMHLYIQKEED